MAGLLEVNLIGGFMPDPSLYSDFRVLTYGSLVGTFANDFSDLGNGLGFAFDYSNGLTLVAGWYA